jgi:hypothetical protein
MDMRMINFSTHLETILNSNFLVEQFMFGLSWTQQYSSISVE